MKNKESTRVPIIGDHTLSNKKKLLNGQKKAIIFFCAINGISFIHIYCLRFMKWVKKSLLF